MGPWFHREVIEGGRLPMFLLFLAFLATFITTRVITRMIRAGRGPFKNNVSSSGLHVHHAVPGLILLVTGAFLSVGSQGEDPYSEISAVLIGIGTSLVLDEFALILHLQDVYWADEGRVSVEIVSLAIACLGLGLVGVNPFDFGDDDGNPAQVAATVFSIAFHLSFVVVCILKGKYRTALFGTFVPFLAIFGAVRLARPKSRWARHYSPKRQERATRRAEKFKARWDPLADRVSDFIAGKPSEPDPVPSGRGSPAVPPAAVEEAAVAASGSSAPDAPTASRH